MSSTETKSAFVGIGLRAIQHDFATTLLSGVFAGWLMALMVRALPAAGSAKIWVVIIITYVIGLGGLSHVVAGSAETFYIVITGNISFTEYLVGFMLPALIGNIIGGTFIVATISHAQVVAGKRREQNA